VVDRPWSIGLILRREVMTTLDSTQSDHPSWAVLAGYHRVRFVRSFDELTGTSFANGVNALCWPRTLAGDFNEVIARLGEVEDITPINEEKLQAMTLSASGKVAARILQDDLRLLRDHGLSPSLDCIRAYPRDETSAVVPTDVYSFHADSAPIPADTYLCTYAGAPSEGLRNDQGRRWIEIPEVRAKLLQEFGGEEGEGFVAHLSEQCYDLHYAPMPDAQSFSFGLHNLWRIAVQYPDNPVPPCIHRAPETSPGASPRLLLIS
jgi:hypothetical protein